MIAYIGKALVSCALMSLTSSQIVVLPGRVGDGETPRVCVFDIDNTLWVQGCDWKNPKGGPTVTVKACHDRGYAIAIDTAEKSDTLGWHKSKHLPFLGFTQEELNDHDLMRHQIKGIDQYTSKIENMGIIMAHTNSTPNCTLLFDDQEANVNAVRGKGYAAKLVAQGHCLMSVKEGAEGLAQLESCASTTAGPTAAPTNGTAPPTNTTPAPPSPPRPKPPGNGTNGTNGTNGSTNGSARSTPTPSPPPSATPITTPPSENTGSSSFFSSTAGMVIMVAAAVAVIIATVAVFSWRRKVRRRRISQDFWATRPQERTTPFATPPSTPYSAI